MMRLPAWQIRPAIDWRRSRLVVPALVVLGHLMLLAWWRDRPVPALHDAPPMLQGRLLDAEPPPASALRPERGARTPSKLPQTDSIPHSAEPVQQPMSAVPAAADAVEARTLDLASPLIPSQRARSHAEDNIAQSTAHGTGHAFGPDASAPRAARSIEESRGAAGRWQARVEVGSSAYCLSAQDPSLRRDSFEKALAVPSLCR
ncbi:hypothetical protein N5I87_15925 [Ralstonia sp. CHL-2022]|uniref:Transmembrane protein n=1 Tax=Ralstonia mojiangensis TaxID=2953895 RepID=A0AAE3LBY5_9RALS|nr:hypothetical protein [Ralstonia mojiangensis]MCT7317495.1 hypothetical protein [Ralstonia mojiangensis]